MIHKILFAAGLSLAAGSALATPAVFDWGVNIDGAVSVPTLGDPVPGAVDISGFNDITGLGQISVTIGGPGPHFFDVFFDLEIDAAINGFDNETGSTGSTGGGAPPVGLSWEIDEPGFGSLQNGNGGVQYFGDIFDNFSNSMLDNMVFFDAVDNQTLLPPDDPSVALGWDFSLAAGEQAVIDIFSSTTNTAPGFFLSQTDPDSNETVFFWTSLNIQGPGGPPSPSPIPEPALMLLLGIGLAGLGVSKRKLQT